MAYYQQPQPTQQTNQPQQEFQGTSYMCCGNPFGDFFDTPNSEVQNTPQKQVQTQNWNSPFTNSYEPYEGRHIEDDQSKRRAEEDVRSVGTRYTNYSAASSDGTKNLSVLATDKAARKVARKQTMIRQPEVQAKSAAVNSAVVAIQKLRRDKKAVAKTETTRTKKELTPEDVRDPESIPGMKSKTAVSQEEEAKTKAFQMISNGEYKFDPRAMIASWTGSGRAITKKDKTNVQEIV